MMEDEREKNSQRESQNNTKNDHDDNQSDSDCEIIYSHLNVDDGEEEQPIYERVWGTVDELSSSSASTTGINPNDVESKSKDDTAKCAHQFIVQVPDTNPSIEIIECETENDEIQYLIPVPEPESEQGPQFVIPSKYPPFEIVECETEDGTVQYLVPVPVTEPVPQFVVPRRDPSVQNETENEKCFNDIDPCSARLNVRSQIRHFFKFYEYNEIYPSENKQLRLLTANLLRRYKAISQSYESFNEKLNVWQRLVVIMKRNFSNYYLDLVGSTFANLSDRKGGLDLTLYTAEFKKNQPARDQYLFYLFQVKLQLKKYKDIIGIELDDKGDMPCLKFLFAKVDAEKVIHIQVNIYCNVKEMRLNSSLLNYCVEKDRRVPPLIIVLKQWLSNLKRHYPRKTFLTGYALTLMAINFLQCVSPPVLSRKVNDEVEDRMTRYELFENSMSLGELFFEFFQYYSNINLKNHIISVRHGKTLKRRKYLKLNPESASWPRFLSIEDPCTKKNVTENINTAPVFSANETAFKKTAKLLLEARNTGGISKIFQRFRLN